MSVPAPTAYRIRYPGAQMSLGALFHGKRSSDSRSGRSSFQSPRIGFSVDPTSFNQAIVASVLALLLDTLVEHQVCEPFPRELVSHLLVRGRKPIDASCADLYPTEKFVVGTNRDV